MKEPNEALAPEAPPGTLEANLSGPAKPEKSPLLREVRSLAVRRRPALGASDAGVSGDAGVRQ